MKRIYLGFILLINFLMVLLLSAFKLDYVSDRASITLQYGNFSIEYVDEYIEPTDHLVSEQIFIRKINSPIEEKIAKVEECLLAGADFKTAVLYSFPLLERTVNYSINNINKEPIDSKIIFTPDGYKYFRIIKEQCGLQVDEENLYSTIYYSLKKTRNPVIKIVPDEVKANVTVEDNLRLTNLRARFSTDYVTSNENRKHNIRLALSKINGTVLASGEEFSFNDRVGKRDEKNGFKTAKIIVKGNYIDGFGGGVCQASTTVYNCALRADMKITMANNHSLQPSYVLPSFDAMVNSGSSDLRFVNTGEFPVFIRSYGTDTKAVVEIYGTILPYTIQTVSEEIYKKEPPGDKEIIDEKYDYMDRDSLSGTKKRVWYSKGETKSKGYLLYYNDKNELLEKRLIRTDVYSSTYGLIAVAP